MRITNATNATYNRDFYNALPEDRCLATYLRHESVRSLYLSLVERAYRTAERGCPGEVSVLDLGAGEGSATLPFLELGAQVLAVDISERQLEQLLRKCGGLQGQLELRCADISDVLQENRRFDIVVANSLLHHIPDYLDLIRRASALLTEYGVFLSFQDPMWKASITRRDAVLSWAVYAGWRLGQGDLAGGIWRRIRRACGFYSATSPYDNVEYHVVRNGVDQRAIASLLVSQGFECDVFRYCSFQSDLLQPWGDRLGVKNTFGVLATRSRC